MALLGKVRVPFAAAALAAIAAGPGCVDIIGADLARYVQRDEKHFAVTGKPDVTVSTFDGAIEVRPWDRQEVQVVIERRGTTKEAADTIEITADQNGDRISVEAKVPPSHGFGWHTNRSARLIVSLPASADVKARSGDGSIDIEGVDGRVTLSSGDGSIRGRRLHGELDVHTGDGSIKLERVNGALKAETGDGSIVADGTFTGLRAHSGDGSVNISADDGSSSAGEWNITTGDGSVTLALPEDFSAEVDAHTGDGGIHLRDVQLSGVTGAIGKHTLRGRIGSGGGTLRVRTGDGSITLKRSSRATT
jgi:DUF4097 and DUF4098 domain-containing protein YvlB